MPKPNFEVVLMTPEWAREILTQKNNMNRKIRKSKLMMYIRSIEAGEWKVTNQGIGIDSEGNLLDGQHRLAAIVKANKAVEILLGTDCDPDTFGVIDIGATRTAGDMLTLSGCGANHNTLATGVKMYISYTENPRVRWGSANSPNHAKIVKYWNNKQELIEKYFPFITKCHKQFKCFSKGAALAFSLIADDYEWRTEEIMEYFTLLSTGANLPAESSILSFRNQLSNPSFRRRGNGGFASQIQLNSHIKCFNDWKRGKAVKKFITPNTPPMVGIIPRDEIIGTNIIDIIKNR